MVRVAGLMPRAISTVLLACWLLACALAASPALHEAWHGEDCGHGEEEGRECIVELLAAGGVEPCDPVEPVAPGAPAGREEDFVCMGSEAAHGVPNGAARERGPPSVERIQGDGLIEYRVTDS